jgi:hypothetical protein
MIRYTSRFVSVLLVLIALLALPGRASAQSVPYFASGDAHFVSPNDFVGLGQATHLGRYSEVGYVDFVPTTNPSVLAVTGDIVYTAANGDELHAIVDGELDITTGAITATVTYVGGTGRFDDASGSSALVGQIHGSGAISVAVVGNIDY